MAGLSCGIVGLPNVGKSTLFNAITKVASAASENYPFCTIEPNVGVVTVPDSRVKRLVEIEKPTDEIYATFEFVDIAGLVKGASQGEGMGNKFLENIHHTDAIAHVVRCFDSEDIVHVEGKVDPIADIETINMELILSDMEHVEKHLQRLSKKRRSGDRETEKACDVLDKIQKQLEDENPIRTLEFNDDELEILKQFRFLTSKKVIYVPNISEDDLPEMDNEYVRKVQEYAAIEGSPVIPVCSLMEEELATLPEEEAEEYLKEMGLEESGLDRLVKVGYNVLGLITYLTAGEKEVRAWTIQEGFTAPEAAGVIHTDFIKGFIRAEITSFDDIDKLGSQLAAKEAGKMRVEGKDYIVQDGDVVFFRVSTT